MSQAGNLFTDEHFRASSNYFKFDFTEVGALGGKRFLVMNVDTFIVPGCVQAKKEYLFFVKHKCSFNATDLYMCNEAHRKAWYVKDYQLMSYVAHDDGRPMLRPTAHLADFEPKTVENVMHKSLTVGESIDASGGSMGGPMGSLGGGYNMSDSVSFDIKDVTIVSDTNGDPRCDGMDCRLNLRGASLGGDRFGPPNLVDPAPVSHAEFNPQLIEFWVIQGQPAKRFNLVLKILATIEHMWDESTSGGFRYEWHKRHFTKEYFTTIQADYNDK